MPTVSNYTRTRIESLYRQNLHPAEMFKLLKGEDLKVSFATVTRIIKKLKLTRSTKKGTSTGTPRKLNAEARVFIEDQMRKDDETTSRTIQKKLARHGVMVHPSTVRRSRKQQGWTLQRMRYCQLIRDANKVKCLVVSFAAVIRVVTQRSSPLTAVSGEERCVRTLITAAKETKCLEFAQNVLETGDTFDNVIFTDECSASLEQFRRMCYRKVGEPARRKPKPKHPLKLHVWAGISRQGGPKICIFEGIMDTDLYCNILKSHLVPFINMQLANHRFMQDNDPKHTS